MTIEAQIVDDAVVITIKFGRLMFAAREGDYFFSSETDGNPLTIVDEPMFVQDVVDALNCEAEDGNNPITRMLDEAIVYACEQGSEAVVGEND